MKTLSLVLLLAFSAFGQTLSREIQFVGNSSTELFYAKNCREAASVPAAYKVVFYSREEAEKKGYALAETCSKPKPAFEKPLDVDSPTPADTPTVKTPNREGFVDVKNLADLSRNLKSYEAQVLRITAYIKIGDYYGMFAGQEEKAAAFELTDDSLPNGSVIALYMERDKYSDALRRQISESPNKILKGTFIFILGDEYTRPRDKDRLISIGLLLDYRF